MPRNQSVICLTWANSAAPALITFGLGVAPWPDLRLPAIGQPSNPRIHPEQSLSSKTDYKSILTFALQVKFQAVIATARQQT